MAQTTSFSQAILQLSIDLRRKDNGLSLSALLVLNHRHLIIIIECGFLLFKFQAQQRILITQLLQQDLQLAYFSFITFDIL